MRRVRAIAPGALPQYNCSEFPNTKEECHPLRPPRHHPALAHSPPKVTIGWFGRGTGCLFLADLVAKESKMLPRTPYMSNVSRLSAAVCSRLKCNRSHPCENCVKRGDAPSCSYAQPNTRKKNVSQPNSSSSPDDMQNRIDRLEGLVLSLMTNGSQSAGPAAAVSAISGSGSSTGSAQNGSDLRVDDEVPDAEESDTEQVTKSFGIMKVDNHNKSYYISEAHWASVLSDVRLRIAECLGSQADWVYRLRKCEITSALIGSSTRNKRKGLMPVDCQPMSRAPLCSLAPRSPPAVQRSCPRSPQNTRQIFLLRDISIATTLALVSWIAPVCCVFLPC